MSIKRLIKYIITEYQETFPRNLIPRQVDIPINLNKIITLIGGRRSGKTFVLFQIINSLLKNRVKKQNILFINFDDERLEGIEPDVIIQAYRELYPEVELSQVYFFFDEVQALKNWEKFVFRLYELYKPKIFLTGSNSRLLAMEVATQLRGRTLVYEIYPLSFGEFLKFKNIPTNFYSPVARSRIKKAFEDFLLFGSFPEIIDFPQDLKIQTLQNYFNTIIYRDIIERYNVENQTALRYFTKRLIANLGKPSSINKIFNELKSQNIKISKNSLYDFSQYLQDVFFAFPVSKAQLSEKKTLQGQKKYYFLDNGLINALTPLFINNYGLLLENIVYLTLRRQGLPVYFWKNSYEIDFMVFPDDNKPILIQVSYDISANSTYEREIKALLMAGKKFNTNRLLLITPDIHKIITDKIKVVDIIELLLSDLSNLLSF